MFILILKGVYILFFIFFKGNIYIRLNKNLLLTLKKNYFGLENKLKKFLIFKKNLWLENFILIFKIIYWENIFVLKNL